MFRFHLANRPRLGTTGLRHDRVFRSAVLGLVTYAIGLLPFYFLTPVHQAVQTVLAQPTPVSVRAPAPSPKRPLPTPTLSQADLQKKAGADTLPVVDSTPKVQATLVPTPTVVPTDPRYAFLLLGYGGAGHDGAYLTDSMMLVVVDPAHKTLSLLSFPRDSWVPMSFNGTTSIYSKINTAYAFAEDPSLYPDRLSKYTGSKGPGTFAADTVSNLLGVPIRYYLALDFTGFRQMIDAVGGIDVIAPDSFSALYPANDDPSINANWITVRFVKGMQHMNGERAIEYARAREVLDNNSEGSDFARARRQRLIMESFKSRLFEPGGLVHLPQLLAIAATHVDTNYGVPDAAQLSQLALGWKDLKIYQSALTFNNYLEEATGSDGAYLLVPSASDHTWGQVRAFGQRFWNEPATAAEMANETIVVENDTGVPGMAGSLTTFLADLGYNVGSPTTGTLRPESDVLDQTGGQANLLLAQLNDDLKKTLVVTADTSAPSINQLTLQLGANDLDLVQQLPPPVDLGAPSSAVGVEKFGVWSPDASVSQNTSPTPIPVPSPLPGASATNDTAQRTGTPSPVRSGTPNPIRSVTAMPRAASPTPTNAKESPIATKVGSPTDERSNPAPSQTPDPVAASTPTVTRAHPAQMPTASPVRGGTSPTRTSVAARR
ncbi:MAG TPA: LCP family protein [Chloroflexota bacterium]|nr:LCP family protein [Chloroflexota bacterium]